MKEIALIFPNQLCLENFPFDVQVKIYLLEHPRYFTDFAFHKQKIILHRASMKSFYDELKQGGYSVEYIEYPTCRKFIESLKPDQVCHIIDPVDHALKHELLGIIQKKKLSITWHESPLFLTSSSWIHENYGSKKTFLMNSFYIKQRKRLNILVVNGEPVGGKWSFDDENRDKIPKHVKLPIIPTVKRSPYIAEAILYVKKHFGKNPGEIDQFNYPINNAQAKDWFEQFLKERFKNFGKYEDAILKDESILFHSVLSPLLNSGLVSPNYVVERAIIYANKHDVPINSLEGFIRQIIGWREFVRVVYQVIGKEQSANNFFEAKRSLPEVLYTAKTGIDPVDDCIRKAQRYAYNHHIERLMVLGNYMLLLEINPDDVYRWFMEMYIDSYDWVMVPNVYGMSQYAHPSMTTKPYVASSNYILKMSDFQKGNWCSLWDSLFWHFMFKHEKKLAKIPRMKFMVQALLKKTKAQLEEYQELYQKYVNFLKKSI